MLNIHIGSTGQGRSVDVGIDGNYAAIVVGSEGRPGGPATNDPRAFGPLSITEARRLSGLLNEAAATAAHELLERAEQEKLVP